MSEASPELEQTYPTLTACDGSRASVNPKPYEPMSPNGLRRPLH